MSRTVVSLILFTGFCATAQPPRFEPAEECSLCHSRLPSSTPPHPNIAPYALWMGSMKANAAVDPYWKAKVRQESALNPKAAALIEDECLSCHAPAQQYPYRAARGKMRLSNLRDMGLEGVTCTVCHQITPDRLGTEASFTANFVLGSTQKLFGPHRDPFTMPMRHHTGYEPAYSPHMLDSALCGSCHTVITPVLDAKGKTVATFLEQAPYIEWRASAYASEGKSCQSCHMQPTATPEYIAHRPPGGPFPPTDPRQPFGRHSFAGGNVRGLEMLADLFPDRATSLREGAARSGDLLKKAVRLTAATSIAGQAVRLTVDVENLAGHKLPTAYPSRRLWLHVIAYTRNGQVVFESGGDDPSPQPHRRVITSPNQAMVYEAELVDLQGQPTLSLLRAAGFSKDNRLLPRGFDPAKALRPVNPVGTQEDADFAPGRDRVIYELPLRAARVRVEALYQSIKPAHAASVIEHGSSEARAFAAVYGNHNQPVVIAAVEIQTNEAEAR